MSIKSISDIQDDAQAAAIATTKGRPVENPYCAETHPSHFDVWNEAYEQAMHELSCFS